MKNGLITMPSGEQTWYKDNEKHRDDDLPAIIYADGDQFWLIAGLQHRENNPSSIYSSGNVRWCLRGIEYTFDIWCVKTNKTPKEKAYLALKYL